MTGKQTNTPTKPTVTLEWIKNKLRYGFAGPTDAPGHDLAEGSDKLIDYIKWLEHRIELLEEKDK